MSKNRIWILVVVVALIIGGLAASWPALHFAKLERGDFVSLLATFALLALLIERTAEVILTIWRGQESNALQADVQRLLSAGKESTDPDVKAAQEALLRFRARTQRIAFPLTFTLGVLLASLGVRVIDQFIDKAQPQPGPMQCWCFNFADVVFTAALLAGGADPIHKVLDAFRKFMEASSAKASGTIK